MADVVNVWGDTFTVTLEGNLSNYQDEKWQLVEFGVNESLAILPESVNVRDIEKLVERFGTAYRHSPITNVYYVAIGHRNHDEISSLLNTV